MVEDARPQGGNSAAADRVVPSMQSSTLIDDPSHWQKRAEEALRVAEQLDDPIARKTMSDIAESYQQLAALAQAKLSATVTKPSTDSDEANV